MLRFSCNFRHWNYPIWHIVVDSSESWILAIIDLRKFRQYEVRSAYCWGVCHTASLGSIEHCYVSMNRMVFPCWQTPVHLLKPIMTHCRVGTPGGLLITFVCFDYHGCRYSTTKVHNTAYLGYKTEHFLHCQRRCQILGRDDLGSCQRFASNELRVANRKELLSWLLLPVKITSMVDQATPSV